MNQSRQTPPQALLFDVFGTVVDWRSGVAAVMDQAFTEKGIGHNPFVFAECWRAQYQPSMEPIRTGVREYTQVDELHLENLKTVLDATGLTGEFTHDELFSLNKAWEKLPPWPDSVEALVALKKHIPIAACSNGSVALMVNLARFGGLHFDTILGADIAKNYKPRPEVYLQSCAALRLAPTEVMMVAAHNDDLVAANDCGLQTAFILRKDEYGPAQTTDLAPSSDWTYVCTDLVDLAKQLGCAS